MLQLPVKRAQRQQRLSTACDNPLLEAKQAQSNAFKLNNLPAQKRLYKRQQHRRQLSAPDESVLLRASGGTTAMPFGIDDGAANIKNVNIVTFNINVFPMAEQQQPSPVSAGLSRQGSKSVFFFSRIYTSLAFSHIFLFLVSSNLFALCFARDA